MTDGGVRPVCLCGRSFGSKPASRRSPLFRVEIACGKVDEYRPVRAGRVAAGVLAERNVAVHHAALDLREFRCGQRPLAEEAVDRPRTDACEERSLRIDPGVVDICRLLFNGVRPLR
jgi:hypothetical protein